MNEEIRADKDYEKAYLVGVQFPELRRTEVEDHLNELEALATTLKVKVVGREVVKIARPSPKYLIGEGKAEEIKVQLDALEADVLIFDDDLAPPQQQAWEKLTKRAVVDRRKVIIDIFAERAQTREARLQVELASLEYTLPRLKRAWTHLERQRGGGSFVGGAGEAQIETDRRLVRDKIARLKREIESVRQQRGVQRKQRERKGVPTAAIVGYTNSGKSSLLNRLTGAGVLQENKLFATLDPTARRLVLPNNQPVVLTDTVGFIRKLPTSLVAAFKSTLEEAAQADFLVHVLDASHPRVLDHFAVTNSVLEELGAHEKPTVIVLNKVDLLEGGRPDSELMRFGERVVATSVHTGAGLDTLLQELGALLNDTLADVHLRIPTSRFDVVSSVHRDGEVLEQKYDEGDVLMHVLFPVRLLQRIQQFTA